jgi:hypothetical protein
MICVACMMVGCLDAPADGPIQITVMPRQASPQADGLGQADVEIVFDDASRTFRRDVQVQVTGARLDVQGSLKVPADGVLRLPIRYDRQPGPVSIEVQAGPAFGFDETLLLEARLPDRFVAHRPGRVLDGAGDSAQVQIDLLVDVPQARPSLGTRLWFTACCAGPSDCADPPLHVPPVVAMDPDSDQVIVTASTRTLAPVAEPTRIEGLIAISLEKSPRCANAALLARVPIDLPVDPFAEP